MSCSQDGSCNFRDFGNDPSGCGVRALGQCLFDVGAQWMWPEPGFLWPTGDKAVHSVLLIFCV